MCTSRIALRVSVREFGSSYLFGAVQPKPLTAQLGFSVSDDRDSDVSSAESEAMVRWQSSQAS